VVETSKERPWWRRVDGAPPGMVERWDRPLSRWSVTIARLSLVAFPAYAVFEVLDGHWGLAVFGFFPFFQLVLMSKARRRQILTRRVKHQRPPSAGGGQTGAAPLPRPGGGVVG
jgi:hypothetical protein